MKKIIIFLINVLSFTIYNPDVEVAEVIPQNQPPSIIELAFIRSLGSTILKVMFENGDDQLFNSSKIEKISRNSQNDTFDVSLRVIGFEVAHDEPFKLIRMTLRFPGDYTNKVLSYHHRYISIDEAAEYSKNTGY